MSQIPPPPPAGPPAGPPPPPGPPADGQAPVPPQPDPYAQPAPQPGYQAAPQPGNPAQPGYPQQPYAVAPPTETLAIVGLITGIVFWPAGIIINPIALSKIKKTGNGGKPLAIVGLILSIVGAVGTVIAIVATVISIAIAAAGVATVVEGIDDLPDDFSTYEPIDPDAVEASVPIGTQGVDADGVGYTVSGIECGITQVGDPDFGATPTVGQYCRVDVQIANNGTEVYNFSPYSVEAFVGDEEFDADGLATIYDPESADLDTELSAGETGNYRVFLDVPVDVTPDRVLFDHFYGDGVEVTLK